MLLMSSHFSQLPSNVLLRRFGARNWLAFIVTSWGLVQLSMGFVTHWGFLALCRVLLGVFEVKDNTLVVHQRSEHSLQAGFFPALVLIVTTWYRRYETQMRSVPT
jgi:MFS family permease